MKKLFIILCGVVLTFSLAAQTDAGTFLLSGNTGLSFASQGVTGTEPSDAWDDDMKVVATNMEFELLGGYFLADGLVAGLAIIYESESTKSEFDDGDYSNMSKSTTNTVVIAPTLMYYIGESGLWLQAQYGFGSVTEKYEWDDEWPGGSDSDSDSDSTPMSILSFSAGYAIYLADNISINPSLGYAMATQTIEDGYYDANTGNDKDLKINTSGLTFNLGIALHLESY